MRFLEIQRCISQSDELILCLRNHTSWLVQGSGQLSAWKSYWQNTMLEAIKRGVLSCCFSLWSNFRSIPSIRIHDRCLKFYTKNQLVSWSFVDSCWDMTILSELLSMLAFLTVLFAALTHDILRPLQMLKILQDTFLCWSPINKGNCSWQIQVNVLMRNVKGRSMREIASG